MRWVLALLLMAGCDDMTSQPVNKAYSTAAVGPGPVPAGRVDFEATPHRVPVLDAALMARGQQEFRAFCTPCHGELGDGRGMIVQRGFSPPPSYHSDRLRQVPTAHIVDVITDGWGAMYSFAARVRPDDRWAIAAYVRALQHSQDVDVATLDPATRALLP